MTDGVGGRELELGRLAEEYHDRCDRFDESHLTGPAGREGRLPRDVGELATSCRHASGVRRELMGRALALGLTSREFHEAIVEAGRRRRDRGGR